MTKDKTPDDKVTPIRSVKPDETDGVEDCDHECFDCPERDECPEAQQHGCGDPSCPECQGRLVQQIHEIAECVQAIRVTVTGEALEDTSIPLMTAAVRLAKAAQWLSTQVYTGDQE